MLPTNLDNLTFRLLHDPSQIYSALNQLIRHLQTQRSPKLGIDTETLKLEGNETKEHLAQALLLIQIATVYRPVLVIDWQEFSKQRSHRDYQNALDSLKILLGDGFLKIFHHALFDLKMLSAIGIEVAQPIFDTMVVSRSMRWMWKWDDKHTLKALSQRLLGMDLDKNPQKSFLEQEGHFTNEQLKYAAKDADVLLLLEQALQPKLTAWHKTHRSGATPLDVEHRLIPLLNAMQVNGLPLNLEAIEVRLEQVKVQQREAQERFFDQFQAKSSTQEQLPLGLQSADPINLSSSAQVKRYLNDHGIEVNSIRDMNLLKFSSIPAIKALLQYRFQTRLIKQYNQLAQKLSKQDGQLYSRFSPVSELGLLGISCDGLDRLFPHQDLLEPHTSDLVKAVESDSQLIVAIAFPELKMRALATLTGEQELINPYGKESSFYYGLAEGYAQAFPNYSYLQRWRIATVIAQGVGIYNFGGIRLQQMLYEQWGIIETVSTLNKLRKTFLSDYPKLKAFHQSLKDGTKGHTLFGRFYQVASLSQADRARHLVEGSAQDFLKRFLIELSTSHLGTPITMIGDVLFYQSNSEVNLNDWQMWIAHSVGSIDKWYVPIRFELFRCG